MIHIYQFQYSHLEIVGLSYTGTGIYRYTSMQVRGFQDHDTYSEGRKVPAILKQQN